MVQREVVAGSPQQLTQPSTAPRASGAPGTARACALIAQPIRSCNPVSCFRGDWRERGRGLGGEAVEARKRPTWPSGWKERQGRLRNWIELLHPPGRGVLTQSRCRTPPVAGRPEITSSSLGPILNESQQWGILGNVVQTQKDYKIQPKRKGSDEVVLGSSLFPCRCKCSTFWHCDATLCDLVICKVYPGEPLNRIPNRKKKRKFYNI